MCRGDEESLSDCVSGDGSVDGTDCVGRIRLGCGPLVSVSPSEEPITSQEPTTIAPDTSTATSPLEASSSSSSAATTVTSPSTTDKADSRMADPQRGFFEGPGLYIFIGGVGAVVVAILVLVQMLLTFWCCYRHKTSVTPYSAKECEDSPDMKEDLKDIEEGISSVMTENNSGALKFQLEQSPPKLSLPTYESIPSNQPYSEKNSQYSSLDTKDAYAQVHPWMGKPEPESLSYEVVADQSTQYQPLDRSLSLSRPKPKGTRFGVVNRTALEEDYEEPGASLETYTREDNLREDPPALPRKGSIPSKKDESPQNVVVEHKTCAEVSTQEESENIYETIKSSSGLAESFPVSSESPSNQRKSSTNGSQEESFYHIIEPEAPTYFVLEKPSVERSSGSPDNTSVSKKKGNSLRSGSESSQSSLSADKNIEKQIASKSSISKTLSSHSSDSESPSSSSSTSTPNHSPQVSRSIGSHSPLLTNVSNGARVTNKYTDSPVGSRKGLMIMEQDSSKRPQHMEPSDRNEMNTLV